MCRRWPFPGCVGLAALLVSAGALAAQEESSPPALPRDLAEPGSHRPQAVRAGYRHNLSYPGHLDRENISSLAMGAMDLFHLGMQDSGEDEFGLRVVKWGLSFWFDMAVTYVVHEYGHISSLSKTGRHDVVFGSTGEDRSEFRPVSGWGLFMQGLNPMGGGVVSVSDEDWSEIQRDFAGRPEALNRFGMMIEAGGLNQEQALVSAYARRLRQGRMSYLDATTCLWTSFGTILYPVSIEESDLVDYSEALAREGYDASPGRLKALSALRLAGGSGLMSLRSVLHGFADDESGFVEPIAFDAGAGTRLFWPEFESYLTQVGPTVKLGVPVQSGAWAVLPSYERSFADGGSFQEAGLRVQAPLRNVFYLEAAVFGNDRGGTWWSGSAEIRPLSWAALSVGYERGTDYTFHRDVYGAGNDFLERSERSLLIGIRIAAAF